MQISIVQLPLQIFIAYFLLCFPFFLFNTAISTYQPAISPHSLARALVRDKLAFEVNTFLRGSSDPLSVGITGIFKAS